MSSQERGSLPKKWREWVLPTAREWLHKTAPSVCAHSQSPVVGTRIGKAAADWFLTHIWIKTDDRFPILFFYRQLIRNAILRFRFVNTCPGYSGTFVLDPLRNASWHPGEACYPCTPEGSCSLFLARNYQSTLISPWLGTFPPSLFNQSTGFGRLGGSGHLFYSAAAPGPGEDTAGCSGWSPPSLSYHLSCSCFAVCRWPSVSSPSHFCTCVPVVRDETFGRWTG